MSVDLHLTFALFISVYNVVLSSTLKTLIKGISERPFIMYCSLCKCPNDAAAA